MARFISCVLRAARAGRESGERGRAAGDEMTPEPRKRTRRVSERARPEADPPPPPSATPRRPQQERGLRRVDAILDAAAVLIAEEGIAGVTMHRVARRSCTTTGSMYHFFPDRESLLRALAERHACELRALLEQVEREAAGQWSRLSTVEAVGRFLDPFLTYVDQHPDLLPLSRLARATDPDTARDTELDRLVIRLAEAVVTSRSSTASPAEVTSRAVTMTAMAEGVVSGAVRRAVPVAVLRRELRRALVAYLDSYG